MDRDFFRKYLDILNESSPPQIIEESIELHDSFDIELNENFVIETGIIGFTKDGIIVEADETLLGLLEIHDIICEDETYDQEEEEVAEDSSESTLTNRAKDAFKDLESPKSQVTNQQELDAFRDRVRKGESGKPTKLQDMNPIDRQQWENNKKQYGIQNEAEYQGRKVPLGKPMKGDVAKSKVYVRKPNGKIVKVNFGDKNMKIKKSNPKRRKSFRARHRCENPGPRWKARYWSCRAW